MDDHSFPILVTGATGFVGRYLIEELQAQGFTNIAGTTLSGDEHLSQLIGSENVHLLHLDNVEEVFALVQKVKPRWVFHLAAMAFVGGSFERGLEVMQNNTSLQYIMLEAVRQFVPQARVLSVSSAYVYGLLPEHLDGSQINEEYSLYPNNPYAVSKLTQDMLSLAYTLSYGLDVVRVRPFNQIGPRQSYDFALPDFAKQVVQIEQGKQEKLMVGNLSAIRDFTDVRDAVKAYILLLEKGVKGEVYNLGTGQGHTMQEVLDRLVSLAQKPIPVEEDPTRLRPVDVPVFVADNQKIRNLGWQPTMPIDQTIADVLEYERTKESGGI